MRVLLTGFEPWGTERRNPSGEVARALGGHVLPVDYAAAGRRLTALIRTKRPELILMLGLAPGRKALSLEALALNVDHCEDRGGQRRWRTRIQKGPLFLRTRLPIDALHRALSRDGVPARISHHAGTFICNHVFYLALARSRVPCGFVHVPPFSSIPEARQVRAVELILRELEKGRSPGSRRSAQRRAPSPRGSRR